MTCSFSSCKVFAVAALLISRFIVTYARIALKTAFLEVVIPGTTTNDPSCPRQYGAQPGKKVYQIIFYAKTLKTDIADRGYFYIMQVTVH